MDTDKDPDKDTNRDMDMAMDTDMELGELLLSIKWRNSHYCAGRITWQCYMYTVAPLPNENKDMQICIAIGIARYTIHVCGIGNISVRLKKAASRGMYSNCIRSQILYEMALTLKGPLT